jgi:PqqD family protein of HPr-rel-A system
VGIPFSRPSGLLVEPIGDGWVAFSPLSGETMMLNDETAAILEVLSEAPGDLESVCDALAADTGIPPSELMNRIAPNWIQLVEGGLVVERPPSATCSP